MALRRRRQGECVGHIDCYHLLTMQWYYASQGRQSSPIDEVELENLVRSGVVRSDTLVWHEGLDSWKTYASVAGPVQATPMPSVADGHGTGYCAECGRVFPLSELVPIGAVTICASCKPLHLQRLREGGHALGVVRYGGFWVRLVARMIDSMATSIVTWIFQIPVLFLIPGAFNPGQDPAAALPRTLAILGLSTLLSLAVVLAYEVYFLSTRGATPGKMVFGLKVVRADGSGISRGLAAGRHFAQWVSTIILGIGYIMAGMDDEKRALHDRICDTRVIYAN
jgi:uncharacterized RDD family membrane protein YckC